jgi:hypothetical protein
VDEILPSGGRDLAELWMRSSRAPRASGCQCQSHNSPGFDPSILRHSGIRGAADEAVWNNVHEKNPLKKNYRGATVEMRLMYIGSQQAHGGY